MTDPQDEVERRLRAADPAGPSRALPPPRIERAELVESIMATTTDPIAPASGPRNPRPRWLLVAAAAVVVAAAGTTLALTAGNDSGHHSVAAPTVKTLKLPAAHPGIGTCIRFTVDILREKPVAFDGTVTEVTDHDVLLRVNHWYRGGSADEVRLTNSVEPNVAMEGGVDFQSGHRYLVTATDGTVNICGYSAEWSADLAQTFEQAFGN